MPSPFTALEEGSDGADNVGAVEMERLPGGAAWNPALDAPHASAPDSVVEALRSRSVGLTAAERASRAHTSSTIDEEPPEPVWHRLLDQLVRIAKLALPGVTGRRAERAASRALDLRGAQVQNRA